MLYFKQFKRKIVNKWLSIDEFKEKNVPIGLILSENGAVAHHVPATWYGWRSKETHEWKIIPRYAILRGLAIISPIIWACTVIAFAI